MKKEDWQQVNEIVLDALELEISQRQEFVEKLCIDAPHIKREVESLLAAEQKVEAENFFGSSAVINYASFFEKEDGEMLAGQQIGNYQIVREIGYGGMGAVYLAERADGKFEQKVALKLLKREMNTSSLRRRFEQERAILASLEHPNIARLLDAGATQDKVPFLAMEYIEGVPIDDYCNQNNLDLSERLDLFRKVCTAVNFAHRNLVVHRDLKPSNILVTADGVPKLLDFGISKILSSEQVDSATVTKLGAMTPSYASPEQLQNKSVTTATDIYSLGIILYELLSGHRPFEAKEEDFKEIYKAVLETEPPPPSALINTISKEFKKTNSVDSVVEKSTSEEETKSNNLRRTLPNTTSLSAGSLRGDLDNIVLKALRKEPERRYSSAENLAEDIHRHQRGLPVTARPNTFSYRAEKFIKRNRASVIAGVLVILAIISGVVATLWQSRVAAAERDRARLEAEKVKKINAYTQSILNFSNPHWLSSNPKRNRDAKISDALDEALKNIDTDLKDEPEIQAEILFTLGQTYTSQGQFDKAAQLLKTSIEKFDQVLGSGNLKSMQATVILGDTAYYTGKLEDANQSYTTAINYFRPVVDKDKTQLRWLVIALNNIGNIYLYKGNLAETIASFRESVKYAEDITGRDRYVIPIVKSNLGTMLGQINKSEEGLNYQNQALEELRANGNEEKLEGGQLYSNIARIYTSIKDYETAEKYYQKSSEILEKNVSEENTDVLQNNVLTSYNYYKEEKYEEAKTLIEKNLQTLHRIFPNGHFTIAYSYRVLGLIYTKTGKPKEGESELREALNIALKNFKEPNTVISTMKMSLGENFIVQKRFDEAKELLNSALDGFIKTRGEDFYLTKECRELLGQIPNN